MIYTLYLTVRGGWSLWSGWGDCSVTCENGARTRTRECNHPPPNNGGTPCPDEDLQYKHCELPMCPGELYDHFYNDVTVI
mgnify:CR=1 FL=1